MDYLIHILNSGFYAIVPFIILLGVLIFVHELGHFLVARWCGVRVEVFSLGFGKKIFQVKKGDTNYAISLIPLGGYVKMFGEQPGQEIPEADKAVSFTHKKVWQRIAIVAAGPLMNFFFAILIFMVVSFLGEDAQMARIGDVAENSKAFAAGFRSGDQIRMINEDLVMTWEDVQKALTEHKGDAVDIAVQRIGNLDSIKFKAFVESKPNPNLLSLNSEIGDIDGLSILSQGTFVGVKTDSRLKNLGLKTGDRIVSINGENVKFLRDLVDRFANIPANTALTLDVERELKEATKSPEKMTITFSGFNENTTGKYSLEALGIESSDLYLDEVVEKTPAATAGLQAGDRILKIQGKDIKTWEQVIETIKSFDGHQPLLVDVLRDDTVLQKEIIPQMTSQMNPHGGEEKRFTIGIKPALNLATYDPVKVAIRNPFKALVKATAKTWDFSVMTLMSFVRLIQNKISPKNIGGVLSIGQAATETFKIGAVQFLQMMAIISVNLFVLNLLPVPVLDGGHLVFYIVEAVKGSPLSLKKLEMAQQVGIVLLMSLMLFALFNDFSRFFGFM